VESGICTVLPVAVEVCLNRWEFCKIIVAITVENRGYFYGNECIRFYRAKLERSRLRLPSWRRGFPLRPIESTTLGGGAECAGPLAAAAPHAGVIDGW